MDLCRFNNGKIPPHSVVSLKSSDTLDIWLDNNLDEHTSVSLSWEWCYWWKFMWARGRSTRRNWSDYQMTRTDSMDTLINCYKSLCRQQWSKLNLFWGRGLRSMQGNYAHQWFQFGGNVSFAFSFLLLSISGPFVRKATKGPRSLIWFVGSCYPFRRFPSATKTIHVKVKSSFNFILCFIWFHNLRKNIFTCISEIWTSLFSIKDDIWLLLCIFLRISDIKKAERNTPKILNSNPSRLV